MNPPAEIPGFYYDPEKRKYFRLLPHHAAPTGAFYSETSVQQLEREKKRAETEAARLVLKKRKPTPGRRRLFRELGDRCSDPAEEVKEIYGRGLKRKMVYELEDWMRVTAFVLSEDADSLYVATTAGNVRRIPLSSTLEVAGPFEQLIHLHPSNPPDTLSLSPEGELLVTTIAGTANLLPCNRLDPILHLSSLSPSIWTSSTCSSGFLLGTSTSVHLLPSHSSFPTSSDVFATSAHTDPTFLAGCRDGGIRLFDARVPTPTPRASLLLRHGCTITHIRPLRDPVNVLVNGLQGCALYDLRYPHPASPSARFAEATTPSMAYEQLRRKDGYMIDLGFDVCTERGVMAVADQENTVRLWSVRTGERVGCPEVESKRWERPCKALRFDGEGRLWSSDGAKMEVFEL